MADAATKKIDQMRRAATTSVETPNDDYERRMAKLRTQARKEDKPFSRVTATERQTFFHPAETEGLSPERLREIGAAPEQQRTLAPMDTARTTVGQPAPSMINAAGVNWSQDALNAKTKALYGRDYDEIKGSGDFDDFISKLRKDPDQRQKMRDDYDHYQKTYIYKGVPPEDEPSTVDLNRRLNQPKKYGTVTSSHEDNWNDSGMTLHTLEGDDGITRHFLEDLETGQTWNMTGHPNAPAPAPTE